MMPTQGNTVGFIVGQLAGVGGISADNMFGEYAIRCHGKIVALICDDQLFVKPTGPGRERAVGAAEVPSYPGAKPYLLIDPDRWNDAGWLVTLIQVTVDALPSPQAKRSKPRTA